MSNEQVVQDLALFMNSTISHLLELIISIPGSNLAISYLKNAYQNDPFRVALELFLVFFAIKYMLSRKYKPNDNNVILTEKVKNTYIFVYKSLFKIVRKLTTLLKSGSQSH